MPVSTIMAIATGMAAGMPRDPTDPMMAGARRESW